MDKPKHPGGRPTDYRPSCVKVVHDYLTDAVPENMDIPTMEGLALKLDVEIKTLYNWGKKHKEFLHAIRRLKKEQKQHLIKTGIFGGKDVNATIIALMLRVNHKMVETTKQEVKLEQVTPLLANVSRDNGATQTTESQEEN
jgi:hypothetical protein